MNESLRERIMGGVVLLVLALLTLPFILKGNAYYAKQTALPTPPKPLPEVQQPKPELAKVQPPTPEKMSKPVKIQPSKPIPEKKPTPIPVKVQASKPAPVKAQRKEPTQTHKNKQWVIQVGNFSNKANATKLTSKITRRGYRTHIKSYKHNGTTNYRVYVGPFQQREQAAKMKPQINKQFSIKSFITKS